MELKEPKAFIFDIQGMSVHDGPGNRTVIFMQGCSLNCNWCSNPEGISQKPILLYNTDKCRLDGNCVADCNFDAINITDNLLIIDRSKCIDCIDYSCTNNCYTKALRISSKQMSVAELMKVIKRDRQFWGNEGGITLSGGEPLLQIDFAEELLKQCYDAYIHTALESCGNIPLENFKKVIPWLDFIFLDLKHPVSVKHKEATSADNNLISNNIKWLSKNFEGRLIIRIPISPGFNNEKKIIDEYVRFFKENNIAEVNILPLHHLGREKYKLVGRKYPIDPKLIPSAKEMKDVKNQFTENGIKCYSGSNTPF